MYSFEDDDDDSNFDSLYVNGHWEWSPKEKQLVFKTELQPQELEDSMLAVSGSVEFKDDIDILEQQRFKKRYQRRSDGDKDVVTLQDVKDVVLYTTPDSLLTPTVVNILHLPATERFIRGLILYIQYFLQVSDEMEKRDLERLTKIQTSASNDIEKEYRENLQDLRLLITKEYCVMITGGGDFKKYHHMGPSNKMTSTTRKDAVMFESLRQIFIQIVWLALGRRNHNKIAAEVHRIFKSQRFNLASHKNPADSIDVMSSSQETRNVFVGDCMGTYKYLKFHSPLFDESNCNKRPIDYRIYGLGTIRLHNLNNRLIYMERAISLPEKDLQLFNMNVGIIGMKRKGFDIMLSDIKLPQSFSGSIISRSNSGRIVSSKPRGSGVSKKSGTTDSVEKTPVYPYLMIPRKDNVEAPLPEKFPSSIPSTLKIDEEQRRKWLVRVAHLLAVKRHRKALLKMS